MSGISAALCRNSLSSHRTAFHVNATRQIHATSLLGRSFSSACLTRDTPHARLVRAPSAPNYQARMLSLWPLGSSPNSTSQQSPSKNAPAEAATPSSETWAKDPWDSQNPSSTSSLHNSLPPSTDPLPSSFSSSAVNTGTDIPSSLPTDLTSSVASSLPSQVQAASSIPSVPISPTTGLPLDGNHIGDIFALGLGGNTPVGLAQNLLEQIHVTIGLPWWATILTISLAGRILLWPFITKGMARGARFLEIRTDVEKLVKDAKESGAGPEAQMRASLEARDLMKKHDASPFGSFPPMIAQAVVVFTFFLALEKMAHLPLESMKEGGFDWIKDLTVPDATWALPAIASLIFLGSVELTEIPQNDPNASRGKNIGRIMILAGFFLLKSLPAGVVLYIGSNGMLQVIQSAFLRVPAVRARLRLPPVNKGGKLPPPPPPTST